MTEKILCGPCGYAENNKNADEWCTVCEEGLCADCEKVHKSIKTSRNHRLIPIEDFRQIENISISIKCKDHDKRLELYCKSHDVAVCLGCVPSRHRACVDVVPLDKAVENVKSSTALSDLEMTLTKSLQNLEQIITNRESALQNFESQKQTIKNTISDTRARILKKLHDLEQTLLNDLDTKHENSKSEANELLTRMQNSKREFSFLREQTSKLKSFASDVQIFLGTRQINEAVCKEIESVKTGIKFVQNYEVNLQLNPSVMVLVNEIDQLGKISVKKTTTSLQFKEATADQAQIQLRVPVPKIIENVHLQLKNEFKVKLAQTTGCTMLSNGNLLLASYYGKSSLVECSEDGKFIRDIPCSKAPFDLTVIDSDCIVVTYGHMTIEILNIKNNTIQKQFDLKHKSCYGISNQGNKLVISVNDGIVITDTAGQKIKTLNVYCGSYVGTGVDRIYFSGVNGQSVHCISMTGEEIWIHKDESIIDPWGITVDDHQNVFVVDQQSKLMTVIQHDGRSGRKLLSETDGLSYPSSLHFNKEKLVLLLCDYKGCTLYNLV